MRQTVVGVFSQQVSMEATLLRLEMRGFRAECIGATANFPNDAPEAPRAPGAWRRIRSRLSWLDGAMRLAWPWQRTPAPRPGELLVKVHANSALEAQAAREILRASGAREAEGLGEGWTNWNW